MFVVNFLKQHKVGLAAGGAILASYLLKKYQSKKVEKYFVEKIRQAKKPESTTVTIDAEFKKIS